MALDVVHLAPGNPIATAVQRDVERQALEMVALPEMIDARTRAAGRLQLLTRGRVPAQVADRLDLTMQEWALHYALMALNSDANYPKVVRNYFEPEHEWFGLQVPGNRTFGGENWDNTYTVIPVDPYGQFELRGQRMDPPVADTTFSIMGNIGVTNTCDSLSLAEVDIAEDGSFTITIGPEAAKRVDGRRNHLQTKIGACYLLIRDTRGDWREVPNDYAIERLSPPLSAPRSLDEITDHAIRHTVEDVAQNHFYMVTPTAPPVNVIPTPFNTGAIGGLVSQGIFQATLQIADDEAYVVRVPTGGSPSQVLTLYDFWLCWMDWRPTTSLNTAQSALDPDGAITYVIAHTDPGVQNWIDTTGVNEPRIMNRWHGLPAGGEALWATGELVKFADLDRVLPADVRRVSTDERAAQLAERVETFLPRYRDR